jgi:hypothetical protein
VNIKTAAGDKLPRQLKPYAGSHQNSWNLLLVICISEVIQTSDGFSRHLETYYGLIRVAKMTQDL